MKKLFMILCALGMILCITAQNSRKDIQKNLRLSGGSFLAYPGPSTHKQTSAPKGKKPFYISHFGRHGSRYPTKTDDFEYVIKTLKESDEEHALTPLGKDVLQRVIRMEQEAHLRAGELTSLGATQQQEIAERMMRRFPQVFEGNVTIEAKSTTSIRSILSMANLLLKLQAMNPKLTVKLDASQHDMGYLRHNDKLLSTQSLDEKNVGLYNAFVDAHSPWERVVGQLYADTAYLNQHVDGKKLNSYLFRLASVLQDMDLRKKMTLYDLFTDEELYENWRKDNVFWYLGFGFAPTNGGKMPFAQRFLLRNIIEQADSCLKLDHPSATLRFGHDTALLPLVCLMGINGYDLQTSDLDKMEHSGWADYKIIPMAANLQLVFYRNGCHDQNILVKVLLNENEATLPLKTDVAPFYHWQDFRDFYLQSINAYDEGCEPEDEEDD